MAAAVPVAAGLALIGGDVLAGSELGGAAGTAVEPGGGTMAGGLAGGILGGCTAIVCLIAADAIATSVPDERTNEEPMENVFRVFGGGSPQAGFSWTPVDPRTVPDYANQAGLPPENSQEFLVQGQVRPSDIIERLPAVPIPPNMGGLIEYRINPANVRNQAVSPFKPR
jgi:hypothetical protein